MACTLGTVQYMERATLHQHLIPHNMIVNHANAPMPERVNLRMPECASFALQTQDSGLASYVAGQIDRSLTWKVRRNPFKAPQKCSLA